MNATMDSHLGYEADYGLVGNRVGLAIIGAMGLTSAVTTFALMVYITYYAFISKDHDQPMVQGIRCFTRSALGVFLCSLLVSDMIQGAAFAIGFKWAADASVHSGVACTVQGFVSQFGDLGSALWSLAISAYTFSLLFLVKKPPVWLTWTVFVLGWTLITVLPIVGPYAIQRLETKGAFYGVSGAWCWIGNGYQLERFLYVYMWIFLSLLTSLVLYGLVYLRFSGRLVRKDGKFHWNSRPTPSSTGILASASISRQYGAYHSRSTSRITESERKGIGKHLKSISKRLMLYPLVYSVVTLPVAACRIGVVTGWKPPLPLYVFAGTSFTSSGLTNVILFIFTRHALLRKSVAIRPQIHVTTHKLTVLEDARGVQTVRLHRLQASEDSTANSDKGDKITSEEFDEPFETSEKIISIQANNSVPPSPNSAGVATMPA